MNRLLPLCARPRVSLISIGVCLTLVSALAGFVVSQPVAAGSAPGVLNCKSVGRTRVITLAGEIPGDYEIFDLKIKRGNEEYAIKSFNTIDRDMDPEERTKLEDNGVVAKDRVITVVEDFKRGVFTVALRGLERYDLRLYALPGTIRARIGPNSKKASFEAMLVEGYIHGQPSSYPKAIRMRCTFDHSI